MGSGGMIVMDRTPAWSISQVLHAFPDGRILRQVFHLSQGHTADVRDSRRHLQGKATLEQLDLLEELALVVRDSTMCGLGQSAPNPVLSTIRYFRHEYEEHIIESAAAPSSARTCRAPCQTAARWARRPGATWPISGAENTIRPTPLSVRPTRSRRCAPACVITRAKAGVGPDRRAATPSPSAH